MKGWLTAATVVMVASALVASTQMGYSDPTWRMNQIDNVNEIALRDEIQEYDKGRPGKDALYFLSIGDGIKNPVDPPDEVLKSFAGEKATYEPASACEIHDDYVEDAKTLKRGTLFWSTGVWWMGDKTVEVDCGYFGGGVYNDRETKRLVYDHGQWKVTTRTPGLD